MKPENGFQIVQLDEGLWAIDDAGEDSMYLVEGEDRALLIDTGVGRGEILPMLRRLTDKPIDLALTHAHIDHMYHAGEFENVYLHHADVRAWRGALGLLYASGLILYHVPYNHHRVKRFHILQDGDRLDLGGTSLKVLHAPGHTPGSVIYCDEKHKVLFTGDAFGSGEAAWMWMPGCFGVRRYRDSLSSLLPRLEPYSDYRFLGGHRLQGILSDKHPHAHVLDIRVPKDMLILCNEMLDGKNQGKRVNLLPILRLKVYNHGHASMVSRKIKIH